MAITLLQQFGQIAASATYDSTIPRANARSQTNLEGDLNVLRSLLAGITGEEDFDSAPSKTLAELAAQPAPDDVIFLHFVQPIDEAASGSQSSVSAVAGADHLALPGVITGQVVDSEGSGVAGAWAVQLASQSNFVSAHNQVEIRNYATKQPMVNADGRPVQGFLWTTGSSLPGALGASSGGGGGGETSNSVPALTTQDNAEGGQWNEVDSVVFRHAYLDASDNVLYVGEDTLPFEPQADEQAAEFVYTVPDDPAIVKLRIWTVSGTSDIGGNMANKRAGTDFTVIPSTTSYFLIESPLAFSIDEAAPEASGSGGGGGGGGSDHALQVGLRVWDGTAYVAYSLTAADAAAQWEVALPRFTSLSNMPKRGFGPMFVDLAEQVDLGDVLGMSGTHVGAAGQNVAQRLALLNTSLTQRVIDIAANAQAVADLAAQVGEIDEVQEYSSVTAFPAVGTVGSLYIDRTANETYRYEEINNEPVYTQSLEAGADLSAAIGAASNGDAIQLGAGTYTLTSTLVINKSISLIGAGMGQTILETAGTSSDPVNAISVTANNVTLKGLTIKHRKTSNTSVESAVNVSGAGWPQTRVSGFLMDACRIEYMEFGVVIRGSDWAIVNSELHHAGGTNSTRRAIGVYGNLGSTFINNNAFTDNGAGGSQRAISLTSTTGNNPNETYEGTMSVENNTFVGGQTALGQFFNQDSFQAGATLFNLVIKGNTAQETSAFAVVYGASANFGNVFGEITVANNTLSGSHGGSPVGTKGAFAIDGTAAFRSSPLVFHAAGNTLTTTTYRSGWNSLSGTDLGYATALGAVPTATVDTVVPASLEAPAASGGIVRQYVMLSHNWVAPLAAEEAARIAGDTALANDLTAASTTLAGTIASEVTRLEGLIADAKIEYADIEIESALGVNDLVTVPSYTVGATPGQFARFVWNGMHLRPGADADYVEQGAAGSVSTTIQLKRSLTSGTYLLAMIAK